MEREDDENEVDEASSRPHTKLQILTLDGEKMEERRIGKSLGFDCAGMSRMNSFEFIPIPYKPIFAQNPLPHFLFTF